MRRHNGWWLVALLFGGFSLTLRAGDDAPKAEKLVGELVKTLDEVEALLKKVDDSEQARLLLKPLQELTKKLADLRADSEKLKLDAKQEDALVKQFETKLYEQGQRIGKQAARIKELDGTQALLAELKRLTDQMDLPTEEPKKKPADPKKN